MRSAVADREGGVEREGGKVEDDVGGRRRLLTGLFVLATKGSSDRSERATREVKSVGWRRTRCRGLHEDSSPRRSFCKVRLWEGGGGAHRRKETWNDVSNRAHFDLCSAELERTGLTPVARSHPTRPSNGVLPNDPHVKLAPLISPLAIAVPIVRSPKLGVAQGRRGPLGPARRDALGRVDGRDWVVVGRVERVEVERARRRRRGRSWQAGERTILESAFGFPL